MFDRIKASLGMGKPSSRTAIANSFDLSQKTFTRALLLRASHYQDEAMKNLKINDSEGKTLNEFAASCASTVAHYATIEAMKNIGKESAFLPHDPVPKHAPMVVAFSLFIIAGIHGQLKYEGIELDFMELAAKTAILFFLFHPETERVKHVTNGMECFKTIATAQSEKVKEWHDNLMQLVSIYVFQWTTEKPEVKEVDCVSLFGSMLSTVFKAAN